MPAPVASGWSGHRVGLAPTGKAPPCHGARGKRPSKRCDPDQSPRAWLRLQLAFERVEEAPIRVLGDDLLRGQLDEARLAHPQRVKPDRVLGVVLPPYVVSNIL